MHRLRTLTASAALLLLGCGKLPTGESPPLVERPQASIPPQSTASDPPLAAPATPTPSPAATPAPTPAPTAPPATGSSCALPSMPECGRPEGPAGVFGCCRAETTQVFVGAVDAAIARVRRERPDLVDGDRVRDEDGFVQAVARALEQTGLCARQGGPADEVGVKNSNSFSEQYDIVFGNGTVRSGGYTVTCRPARF